MANQLISVKEYKDFIKDGQSIILFKSNWCRTSIMMAIAFDKLAKKYVSTQAKFAKMDIDNFNEVVEHAKVGAIPEFLIYKDGKVEGRQHCTQSENLETFLREFIIKEYQEDDSY